MLYYHKQNLSTCPDRQEHSNLVKDFPDCYEEVIHLRHLPLPAVKFSAVRITNRPHDAVSLAACPVTFQLSAVFPCL